MVRIFYVLMGEGVSQILETKSYFYLISDVSLM